MRLIYCSLHLASNRAPGAASAAPPSAGGDGGWPRQRRLQEACRPPTATGPFKAAEDSEQGTGIRPALPFSLLIPSLQCQNYLAGRPGPEPARITALLSESQ